MQWRRALAIVGELVGCGGAWYISLLLQAHGINHHLKPSLHNSNIPNETPWNPQIGATYGCVRVGSKLIGGCCPDLQCSAAMNTDTVIVAYITISSLIAAATYLDYVALMYARDQAGTRA
jgi:hypothetical protein